MKVQMIAARSDTAGTVEQNPAWNRLYQLGAISALLVVLVALAEILITFLPNGYITAETVTDWFALLQNNRFLGLRNLGLLNIAMTALSIPMIYSLYAAHRKANQPFAALAMILSYIGITIFYSTNKALPMLELSHQYATAATQGQKAMIEAAGQALLSAGQGHAPGTFLAFFFSEIAGMLMALVLLRGKVFSRLAALAGLIGYSLLLVYEVCSSFIPSAHEAVLLIAILGGLLNMTWYILVARRLFQLSTLNPSVAK